MLCKTYLLMYQETERHTWLAMLVENSTALNCIEKRYIPENRKNRQFTTARLQIVLEVKNYDESSFKLNTVPRMPSKGRYSNGTVL